MQKPVIAVHGGAGTWQPERQKPGQLGVKTAAKTGYTILKRGGSALDAVEAAVNNMEDNPVFNAGIGSTLTIDGRIEMEASIMDGKTLNAGATGLLHDIKNPISLARITMENTDYVFIVADGAEKLAQIFKLPRRNPMTELRQHYWKEQRQRLETGELETLPKLKKLVTKNPKLFETADTVGAVALDKNGNTAAATSTGGYSLKLPGRIGDSPLIGAGNYADNQTGACSATGIGEVAIRLVLAKHTCDQMSTGKTAQKAAENAITLVNQRLHTKNSMGLIAVDTKGTIGAAHNTPNLCWAYMTPKTTNPKTSMTATQILEPTEHTNL
jgi:beta-aspartyl-peptidase (threonine type)